MHFLLLYEGSAHSRQAIAAGAEIARQAQARMTLLVCGRAKPALEKMAQEAKELMGSAGGPLETRLHSGPPAEALAIELERRPVDLLVLGLDDPPDLSLAQQMLRYGEHHLLLVCQRQAVAPAPRNALICVARGEPGKADVLFAGRLVRHLEAQATLLAVLPEGPEERRQQASAESFLAHGARTLQLLGVPAQTVMRRGAVTETIARQFGEGGHDLLVLGAPLADRDGAILFDSAVAPLLQEVREAPVLLVRYETAHDALARAKGARLQKERR